MSRIVIVGASLGGTRVARALRRGGFDGEVVLLGDEPHEPYDRPPLSKSYLTADDPGAVSLALQRPDFYDTIDLRLGHRAVALDAAARTVTLADRSEVTGDHVVLATGSRARTLPGTQGQARVLTLRTLDDAARLRRAVTAAERLLIVGAGFIGCEVAASARAHGVNVTLVEPLPAPLARGLGEQVGAAIGDLHLGHGVDVRLGVGVDGVVSDDDGCDVTLDDGTEVRADVVLVGIGAVPNTEWLADSGLELDSGVLTCDERCRVAGGGGQVWAVGDIASWPSAVFDRRLRVEHWTNATEMATVVAKNLTGTDMVHDPVPYVWSDQYDHKIQVLGAVSGDHDVELLVGEPGPEPFLAAYLRDGRVEGVAGIDWPRGVMGARGLIEAGASLDSAKQYAAGLA